MKPSNCIDSDSCNAGLFYLITAHSLTVQDSGSTGHIKSSRIDKIAVTQSVPEFGSSPFQYWMGLSPFGLQALAFLRLRGGGMLSAGGSQVQRGFRGFTGRF